MTPDGKVTGAAETGLIRTNFSMDSTSGSRSIPNCRRFTFIISHRSRNTGWGIVVAKSA